MRNRTSQLAALTAVLLFAGTIAEAQQLTRRKPLTLGLFLRPYKPQSVTPRIFGLLPENKYLQEQIKLTAAQKKRMREIEIQLTRVSTVLLDKEIGRELAVSDGQRERIRGLLKDAYAKSEKLSREWRAKRRKDRAKRKKRAAPRKTGGKNAAFPTPANSASKELAALRKQVDEIEAACDSACLKVLTRTQQKRFHRLSGRPIEVAKIFNMKSFKLPGIEGAILARPFKPQTTTPRVFGMASHHAYIRKELQVSRDQKRRMRQIEIQLTRPSSILLEADVSTELALTNAQLRRIRDVRSQSLVKMRQRLRKAKGKAEAFRKKLAEARANGDIETLKKLREESLAEWQNGELLDSQMDPESLNVLTAIQKRKFKALQGRPVDAVRLFHPKTHAKTKPLKSDV